MSRDNKFRKGEIALSESVSRQLAKAIGKSGLSLREISRLTGVDVAVLSRFVRGERGISDQTLSELCRFLNLELRPREQPKKDK